MAKCPSCALLLPHGSDSCSCGTPTVMLNSKARQAVPLVAFAVMNLVVTVTVCTVLFSALAK